MIAKGRNGNAKLTWSHVRWIRKLYTRRGFSQARLARLFGVTPSVIWKIVNGKTWATVTTIPKTASTRYALPGQS